MVKKVTIKSQPVSEPLSLVKSIPETINEEVPQKKSEQESEKIVEKKTAVTKEPSKKSIKVYINVPLEINNKVKTILSEKMQTHEPGETFPTHTSILKDMIKLGSKDFVSSDLSDSMGVSEKGVTLYITFPLDIIAKVDQIIVELFKITGKKIIRGVILKEMLVLGASFYEDN
jgi:hypothetical protein